MAEIKGSKTAELPQISPADVDLTEEQFATKYKDVLGMMGFKVEQANRALPVGRGLRVGIPGTDAITITSPPDENENTVSETFGVDVLNIFGVNSIEVKLVKLMILLNNMLTKAVLI